MSRPIGWRKNTIGAGTGGTDTSTPSRSFEEWEHSSVGWLFGVSSHIYKRVVVEALRWLGCVARGNLHGAFTHETNLWFSAGFIGTRYREHHHGRRPQPLGRAEQVRQSRDAAAD